MPALNKLLFFSNFFQFALPFSPHLHSILTLARLNASYIFLTSGKELRADTVKIIQKKMQKCSLHWMEEINSGDLKPSNI